MRVCVRVFIIKIIFTKFNKKIIRLVLEINSIK